MIARSSLRKQVPLLIRRLFAADAYHAKTNDLKSDPNYIYKNFEELVTHIDKQSPNLYCLFVTESWNHKYSTYNL